MMARRMRPAVLASIVLLATVVAGPARVRPQDAMPAPDDAAAQDGYINAASLRPMPEDASIAVRPWDDSPDNVILARDIEDHLRRRGFMLSRSPQLVLSFSVREQQGRWSSGSRRQLIELHGRAGPGEEDVAQAQLNLYSTEKGGVFNEGAPGPTERSVYTLELTLDGQGGRRIWQGEATARLGRADGHQLYKQMIPPLVDAVGKTVRNQPFAVK